MYRKEVFIGAWRVNNKHVKIVKIRKSLKEARYLDEAFYRAYIDGEFLADFSTEKVAQESAIEVARKS